MNTNKQTISHTPTIDSDAINNTVREILESTDSRQVSEDILRILMQTYQQIVEAPSHIVPQAVSAEGKKDPNWRRYKAMDMDEMRQKIQEQNQREKLFAYILYPTIADVKYSTHYAVFKTFVAKELDKQEFAREAKNEHKYIHSKHAVTNMIRSLIK